MKNPTEEAPAEPDFFAEAPHVEKLTTQNFNDFISSNSPVLVMFFAPWCGHCKSLKPEYAAAAETVKKDKRGYLAAVDCTKDGDICGQFEVKSYPTVKYFKDGKEYADFGGQRTKEGLVEFMKSEPEAPWKATPSDVYHATAATFESVVLKEKLPALVMFYAPWCGHCKTFKPAFQEAATLVKNAGKGHLVAVDCTKDRALCQKYGVKSFPTVTFFESETNTFAYPSARTASAIMEFMRNPQPPPPPPPGWETEPGTESLNFLKENNFDDFLSKNPKTLVMFYAPWCGHCKAFKPAFQEAAATVKKAGNGALAAVNCDEDGSLCRKYGVDGYPTILYFKNGQKEGEFQGGRTADGVAGFMQDPEGNIAAGKATKPTEPDWSKEETAKDIAFLTTENFDKYMSEHSSVLTMFYAPWCGHCKKFKPALEKGATELAKNENKRGYIAAVNCDDQKSLCAQYNVGSYPTLKYFKDGKVEIEEYTNPRTFDGIMSFMKAPGKPFEEEVKEKEEKKEKDEVKDKKEKKEKKEKKQKKEKKVSKDVWEHPGSEHVMYLGDDLSDHLQKNSDVLVMFYAPWCGHCKAMKADYARAAQKLTKQGHPGLYVAVDCTVHTSLCSSEGVKSYPTIKYFHQGKESPDKPAGRTFDQLVSFMTEKVGHKNVKDEL
eukprot:TRINITY_DN1177_c0_g1_i1.p1 TRINITY_DN1177_c0_g1~~TRINITY_DN1177_c0_g1_i1.p1  ORF type:complete len:661 (+),score=171.85 TRINITY_DN1177_c0_g1_i1:78-2060(+)